MRSGFFFLFFFQVKDGIEVGEWHRGGFPPFLYIGHSGRIRYFCFGGGFFWGEGGCSFVASSLFFASEGWDGDGDGGGGESVFRS